MKKTTANAAFLKGLRYMFWFALAVLSALFIFSVSISASEKLQLKNVLLGYAGVVITSLIIAFLVAYTGVKKGIEEGESSDSEIFRKNGKLNLNFFKTE